MCDCADELERQRKLAIEKKQQKQVEAQRKLEKKQHERDLKQLKEEDNVILERQIEELHQKRKRELEQEEEQTRVLVRTLEAERDQRRRDIEGYPYYNWKRYLYGCILLFGLLGFVYHKRCKIMELLCIYNILPTGREESKPDVEGEEICFEFVGFIEDKKPPPPPPPLQKPCVN